MLKQPRWRSRKAALLFLWAATTKIDPWMARAALLCPPFFLSPRPMSRLSREPQPEAKSSVGAQAIHQWVSDRPWLGKMDFSAGAPTRFRLVQKGAGFVLELPSGSDPKAILQFLNEQEKWLALRAWTRDNRKKPEGIEALPHAEEHGWIWIDGQQEKLVVEPVRAVQWSGPGTPLRLPKSACASEGLARSQANLALKRLAQARLSDRLRELAIEAGLPPPPFLLADSQAFWGQRDSRSRIKLRFDLIQMPVVCQDHVICHELAHAWHMDHSPAFWKQLGKLRPDWKSEMDTLRQWEGILGHDAMKFPNLD